MVTVIGVKAKEGKKQLLEIDKEYKVSESDAEILVKSGRAKKKTGK